MGFVGTETSLYKTIDGGKNWYPVWDTGYDVSSYRISDICFQDDWWGWFTLTDIYGVRSACFGTTDGGETWAMLPAKGSIGFALFFNITKGFLLLGTLDSGIEMSTDFGNSWRIISHYPVKSFSFFSDTYGIASCYLTNADTTTSLLRTMDGGLTWLLVDSGVDCQQPLAIQGTPIGFEADYGRLIIRKTTDYGATWRVIKDFGPFYDSRFNEIAPFGNGYIKGDLSRLYIQTDDSGMYVSTDSGITWLRDGGPSYQTNFSTDPLLLQPWLHIRRCDDNS
ncbi:MAG TPA: hypothetical protein VGM92_04410 [Candidatus Kapabacteria bacterium]